MALDTDKIDDTALALLYLTLHDDIRAWKGMDWGVLDRLHNKGMIHEVPRNLTNHTNYFFAHFVWLRGSCACLPFFRNLPGTHWARHKQTRPSVLLPASH